MKDSGKIDLAERYFFTKLVQLIEWREIKLGDNIESICGVDAHYYDTDVISVAVLSINGEIKESAIYRGRFTFPYVAGLFYLHEGPFAVAAVRRLSKRPELVCFDSYGVLTRKRIGMASICGAVLGIPSIGIAKSRFAGSESTYKDGISRIMHSGVTIGFSTKSGNLKRYWTPGYGLSISDLERIIHRYGDICLMCMNEADKISKGLKYP